MTTAARDAPKTGALQKILDAFAAGKVSWPDTAVALKEFPYATVEQGAEPREWQDVEAGAFPGNSDDDNSFYLVTEAHARGYLTDAQFDEVHAAITKGARKIETFDPGPPAEDEPGADYR